MKALSLIEPWATLCVLGAKRYETRSWQTAVRGWIAIHASAKIPPWAVQYYEHNVFAQQALASANLSLDRLALGCVIGRVFVAGCDATSTIKPTIDNRELSFGDFGPGRFAFRLEQPVRFARPIPARGRLGFWEWKEVGHA